MLPDCSLLLVSLEPTGDGGGPDASEPVRVVWPAVVYVSSATWLIVIVLTSLSDLSTRTQYHKIICVCLRSTLVVDF